MIGVIRVEIRVNQVGIGVNPVEIGTNQVGTGANPVEIGINQVGTGANPVEIGTNRAWIHVNQDGTGANPADIDMNPVEIAVNPVEIGESEGCLHGAEPAIHEIQHYSGRDLNLSAEDRRRSDSGIFPSHSRCRCEVLGSTNPNLPESAEDWARENLSTVR